MVMLPAAASRSWATWSTSLAVSTRSRVPLLEVMGPLMVMSLAARRVRTALVPVDLTRLTSALTVMLPSWVKASRLVETVTLVPALRADWMALAETVELLVLAMKRGWKKSREPVVFWMVTLEGSRSQVPPGPAGAETSGAVATSRNCLPEVSTKPPWPPAIPPRAERWA